MIQVLLVSQWYGVSKGVILPQTMVLPIDLHSELATNDLGRKSLTYSSEVHCGLLSINFRISWSWQPSTNVSGLIFIDKISSGPRRGSYFHGRQPICGSRRLHNIRSRLTGPTQIWLWRYQCLPWFRNCKRGTTGRCFIGSYIMSTSIVRLPDRLRRIRTAVYRVLSVIFATSSL